jgi:threonyl-tRNA synthetase
MSKEIDLNKTIYELSRENPEIVNIMKELGFESIAEVGMLNTAGRFMTIPKGAAMKSISLEKIKQVFESKGYTVKD